MKNPIQIIKNIIRKSSESGQQVTLNPAEVINVDTSSSTPFDHKMIEPSIEERLRKRREEWLDQVEELIKLIRVDFVQKYCSGKTIDLKVDSRIYNDEYSRETYKAPILTIEVDNEIFELARSRAKTFQRDHYYSMSRTSNYNGRYVHFQRGTNCWFYTKSSKDTGWKALNEEGFRDIMHFIN